MQIDLTIKNINNSNFEKYGEIISTHNKNSNLINNGYALKYDNLASILVSKDDGLPNINIYKAKMRKFPIKIEMMEKHPLGTQLFYPLSNSYFISVVAPEGKVPSIKKIESFLIPPHVGINYKIGIWHYPLIVITDSDFIVIDRKGPKKNLEIFNFKNDSIKLNYE